MTHAEALQRANVLKGHLNNADVLSDYKDEINALSVAVLGKAVRKCNCKDRYADALIEVITYLNKHDKIMSEYKAKLKRGILIHYDGEMYTCLNITDDVAVAYLTDFPQNAHYFEVLPDMTEKKEENNAEEVAEPAAESAEDAAESAEDAEVDNVAPTAKKARKTAKKGK